MSVKKRDPLSGPREGLNRKTSSQFLRPPDTQSQIAWMAAP
jgi:hypothetical protein